MEVVTSCQEKIQHWKKVENDYEALQERLNTLPDKLSYDIMVPFGPLAFMPGKLVHTNEVTVLLGDNWFSKCSAKQAIGLVEHRKKHVRKALDDLQKVMKNFESRIEFTEDLKKMSDAASDIVDIREEVENDGTETKGKRRTAHKPHSKPKVSDSFEVKCQENGMDTKTKGFSQSDEELWARLEELERREEMLDELDRTPLTVEANGEDTTSSEEEKDDKTDLNVVHRVEDSTTQDTIQKEVTNSELFSGQVNGPNHYNSDDEDDLGVADDSVPTIFFSHTVEPKRVRINTGKNTTLKFSEKKEEAKRKRKNSNGNGHLAPELPNIRTPADIYRVFVDVVNGEYVPRKSILKSRSRENSVCSDTSESSAAEFDDRRGVLRSISYDEATYSDNSEGILEEEEVEEGHEHLPKKLSTLSGTFEAFSGTVIEKEPLSPLIPHPSIAYPVLPTIPERKSEEVLSEASEETTKRISKFKAARMQQTN
ncbi:unconventional prefoldin RPB5 interactor 1 isoform X2 [Pelodiscus sinensis]|uniref:Protein phosphatase 1 regulatory subunit 19 n=1 Tax=Pelodiscus sinensis TaxID=13735 RepID=K7GFR3_PELSI|nr:unconventional prefoldin RPB5 interactor 1 [Pelodiscus sinensis]|eukprot:XP_006121266.1 unconventional prefoldin RPB5 interactor 1 [Pelodiscus sinensis]